MTNGQEKYVWSEKLLLVVVIVVAVASRGLK